MDKEIGEMSMPADFRYKEIFLRGKPYHSKTDDFRIRHPSMDVGKRATIFAPFDALKGFNEAVAAKDELYEDRRELNEEDISELDRRMGILHRLTANSRMARENDIRITVTYFVPCEDPNSESYGLWGQYHVMTGICRKVDAEVTKTILMSVALAPRPQAPRAPRTEIDEMRIPMEDILKIDSPGDIFRKDREEP